MSDLLNDGKYILFIGIDEIILRIGLLCLLNPLVTKGQIPVMIHSAKIILKEKCILD